MATREALTQPQGIQERKATMANTENKAEVLRAGALDMQVCVPAEWADAEVKAFAEKELPCGTTNGWFIRKQGDERLAGHDERVKCDGRSGYVHIMLEA